MRLKISTPILLFSFLLGCGGGNNTTPPLQVSVTVSPSASNIHITNTQQFTATVRNTTNTAVTWTVSGSGCTGAACGTVSTSGLYTAPASVPAPASVSVTATSVADPSKSESATATVLAAIIVTVTPPGLNVAIGTTQQFSATIQNAINSSLNWSLSGSGCTGAACGTISATGLYTAPIVVPTPPAIAVIATSVEDTKKSGSTGATIISLIAVNIWPSKAQVTAASNVNYGVGNRQFGVLVTGFANTAVTWTVSGPGCTGNTCGTISTAGLYAPPNTIPNPEYVTVTATSQADPGKSATATVELVPADNAKLNGHYAFFYQGFAANVPGQVIGTLVADGHGNITSGICDRTWPTSAGGNLINAPFTGTYTVGPDNRGTMSFNGSWGVVTFAFALNATGDKAFMQPFFDSASTHMMGTLVKQDDSAFNNLAINGNFAFQLLGADSTYARRATLGRIHADGSGNITAGNMDINDGATVTNNTGILGTYTVAANSRDLMDLHVPGLGVFRYVIYVISSDRFFMSSIDTIAPGSPMLGGEAFEQTGGPFSLASLNTTTVFDLLGGIPASKQAKASIGLLTADGKGNIAGVADINNNNTLTLNTSYTATYSIDTTGRGFITTNSVTFPSAIFYLVNPNKALLLEAPGATVQVGSFEPQTQLPYSNALMTGQFISGGPNPPPFAANGTVTGTVWYDGAGNLGATIDINSVSGGLVMGTGPAGNCTTAANGRAVINSFGGGGAYMFLISPVKYVEILGIGMPTSQDDQKHLYKTEQ